MRRQQMLHPARRIKPLVVWLLLFAILVMLVLGLCICRQRKEYLLIKREDRLANQNYFNDLIQYRLL